MANIHDPQADLPRTGIGFLYSGGIDFWDEGVAGLIVTEEYFEAVTPPTSSLLWIKISGLWKQATCWIKVAGTWKQATPFIKVSGVWK